MSQPHPWATESHLHALTRTAEVAGTVLGATIHFLSNQWKASDSKHMLMF